MSKTITTNKMINFLLLLSLLTSLTVGSAVPFKHERALAATPTLVPDAVATDTPVIDGVKDAIWCSAFASDPLGDMSEPNLDLQGLYLLEDDENYFLFQDTDEHIQDDYFVGYSDNPPERSTT